MRAPEVGPSQDRVAAYHKQKIQQGYDGGGGASPSQSPSARNSRIVAALVPQGESSRSRSHGEPAPHQHKELRGGIGAGFVPRYVEIPCACRRTIGSYRLVLGIVLSREGSQLRESRTRDEHHCVRSVFFHFVSARRDSLFIHTSSQDLVSTRFRQSLIMHCRTVVTIHTERTPRTERDSPPRTTNVSPAWTPKAASDPG